MSHPSLDFGHWVNGTPIIGESPPETIDLYSYTAPVMVDQVALASGLAEQPPVITNALLNNGQFVLSGTNGFAGDNYYLLSSTSLAWGQWKCESANTLDADGMFSITNTVPPGPPQTFYRLQLQRSWCNNDFRLVRSAE